MSGHKDILETSTCVKAPDLVAASSSGSWPAVSSPIAELLAHTQLMRRQEQDLVQISNQVSECVEYWATQLGTDTHPDLGPLWFQYGDLLLEIEEKKITPALPQVEKTYENLGALKELCQNTQPQEPQSSEKARPPQGENAAQMLPEEEESNPVDDEEVAVAWECFEMARRCLEQRSESSADLVTLANVHVRITDFLMFQENWKPAVEECETAVKLCKEAEAKLQADAGKKTRDKAEAEEVQLALHRAQKKLEETVARVKLIEEAIERSQRATIGVKRASEDSSDVAATANSETFPGFPGAAGSAQDAFEPTHQDSVKRRKRDQNE
mmetsp:Transcript_64426/g.122913  ORF Transcript_64426/g.122913 Transcript_64426/m.122913 type:complete len:326 (+) Transcript_64426:56-1033(+)